MENHAERVRGMFNRIARRYDLVNRVLSLGRDVAWRRRLAKTVAGNVRPPCRVLDLATGTGDVLLALAGRLPARALLIGLDGAESMLSVARAKLHGRGIGATLVQADGQHCVVAPGTIDCTTVAFGVRNYGDLPAGLRAIYEALKPAGFLAILEFSMPKSFLRHPYRFYLRHVAPFVGGWLTGNRPAYRYLNTSIEQFPAGDEFCAILSTAGFNNVHATPMTFGIATLYTGYKGA